MTHEYEYARPKWWDISVAARMRRRQLVLSVQDLRRPIPYARLVFYISFVLFIEIFCFTFTNVVYISQGWEIGWLWFSVFMATCIGFCIVTWWHSVVMRWWPRTTKWCIGDAPEIPVKGEEWSAGECVEKIRLPKTKEPPPANMDLTKKENFDKYFDEFFVEMTMAGNCVENLPWPRRRPFCLIARAQFESEGSGGVQAGIKQGKRYIVQCRPDPYVAMDLPNWRGYDWLALARHKFGSSRVTNRTIIVLALDPLEPKTWKPTPQDQAVREELYLAQQSRRRIRSDYAGWLSGEEDREGMKGRIEGR